jgi:hydroxymethylglutaryl-CoA reductase
VNTACEALAPKIAALSGGRVNLRILSNLSDRRMAWAECVVRAGDLGATAVRRPPSVVSAIIEASHFAERDPYRAATHNKGVMNGVDAVALATGQDWRAIEAAAHAYAARSGSYGSLTRWWATPDGDLAGRIELPLAVGIVGGATRVHPTAQAALRLLGVTSARELAEVMACVGLAQNFAAIRALATEGIQAGHMALHARQLAIAAGAQGEAIERIAAQLVAEKNVRLERAQALVKTL